MTAPLLGIPEVCAHLNVAPSTLRKYRASGALPEPDAIEGGRVLWKPSTVKAMRRPPDGRANQPLATKCKWGHPMSGPNLYVSPRGKRCCRSCMKEADRRRPPRKVKA